MFQTAISEIDHGAVQAGPVLDGDIVQRINAAGPSLVIETANCEAAKHYEANATLRNFLPVLLNRLRIFSPATLKGVCPELETAKAPVAPAAP